ncbi:hypothetical protein KXD40_009301 [Peronospora effusa]|uniref:Uncharacterized protein n=1 Tax=Peronospora effusa TaxID=542832 RepID=A0A3M6VTY1_9STRA|nr:hypothetical protein DD238_001071 [Peronospora effusa]RQM17894.1 hypothetical protein DD237_002251 [Peronospora effusa]UIZ28613.1 hypothetical protein KXD40_009301 [Peronospora effusa]
MAENFQRYELLLYAAFSIQADVNTMHAGNIELESCYGVNLLMRDFLSLPESVLDANCTYANAILSPEDVKDVTTHA